MILLDMKNSNNSSSPLSLSTPKEKPAQSFSELLRGVSDKKDAKVIQNGSLVLSLGAEEKNAKSTKTTSKTDTLLRLLKNEEKLPALKAEEPLELNPKLTAALTAKEIKALVLDAKNYLKTKIQASDDYKKSQIKELPKTLKSLVEAAKKFGVDISKITFEEVKAYAEGKPKYETLKQEDIKTLNTKEDRENSVKEVKPQTLHVKEATGENKEVKPQTLHVKEAAGDNKEVKPQTLHVNEAAQNNKEVKPQTLHVKEAVQDNKEVKPQTLHVKESKETTAEILQTKENKDAKAQIQHAKETQKSTAAVNTSTSQTVRETRDNEKLSQISNEIKATPLFKAQAVVEHATTEQLVQVKANNSFKTEQKTPKDKADETLKLLLRGEKPPMSNPVLTADFSVASARVIAPSVTSESSRKLEHLLSGESSAEHASGTHTKTESLGVHKADSFEVKLNEAKQMIKYLSGDVKTAIEDYKSPFTRVKIQLNPQRLGEVDLTIVQRGKNLHVNISSNNSAVNTLAMNANELRTQLSNNGINNATLNFSNNSQNGDTSAGGQHQQRQNERQAHEEYSYFENEEANEEILSSLEIIVPHYG